MLTINKSQNNKYFQQDNRVGNVYCRQTSNHDQNGINFKLKQNMKKELTLLPTQSVQASSQQHSHLPNFDGSDSPNHYMNYLSPNSQNNNINSSQQNTPSKVLFGYAYQQNDLYFTAQLLGQDSEPNESQHNDTGEIMDSKFNQLLEINQEENYFGIQSKFIIMKSQKYLKDPEIQTYDHLPTSKTNTHEQLLEQENYYLRDQLIQFSQVLQTNKSKNDQIKVDNKILKKQNSRLKKQIKRINQYKRDVQALLFKKDQTYAILSKHYEQQQKVVQNLNHINKELRFQLQALEKEIQYLQEKLQKREKYIELAEEQKLRLKQDYQYYLSEKQKEIHQLNDLIYQIKQKSKQNMTDDNSQLLRNLQDSKLFEDGANSICLSLAEAQSLKNIIQQKQQLHKAEVIALKQQHYDAKQVLINNIQKLQQRIDQISNVNCSKQNYEIQQIKHSNFHSDNLPQENYLLDQCNKNQIKKLQRQLHESHQEKAQLKYQISQLQQRFLQRQQDEEIQELLQNCVNELQKSRKLNFLLTNQNNYLKQLFCSNHNQSEVGCIYN